jgi:hypothetical protein
LAATYASQATAILREAYRQGKIDAEHLKTSADLDRLRSYEEFNKLLAEEHGGNIK